MFVTNSKFFCINAPLKKQARKSFFYGKDGLIEEDLKKIENLAAPLIANIIKTNSLPKRESDDHLLLLLFVILSELRTHVHPQKIIDLTKKQNDLFYGSDPINQSQFTITQDQAVKLALKYVRVGAFATTDLHCKLIINNTSVPFITSDNPVVKYNQLLEVKNQHGGITGYSSKGLQIFFPISPKHLILFYDHWAYKVDIKKSVTAFTNTVDDIHQINLLQFLNCDNIIYFNHEIDKLKINWFDIQAGKYEKANKSIVNKYENKISNDFIIHTTATDCKIRMTLSFIKFNKHAKKFEIGNRTVQLRKNYLDTESFMKEVMKKPFTRFFTDEE